MQDEFHAALESGDVKLVAKASARLFPHLPQPESLEAVEASMHMARTQMPTISFKARAYSHRWLTERGLPSQLPDDLKPKAEQVHPKIVEGVLVAVMVQDEEMRPLADEVEKAMNIAVEDCYANGDTDPELVRQQMMAARARTRRALLGTTAGVSHG